MSFIATALGVAGWDQVTGGGVRDAVGGVGDWFTPDIPGPPEQRDTTAPGREFFRQAQREGLPGAAEQRQQFMQDLHQATPQEMGLGAGAGQRLAAQAQQDRGRAQAQAQFHGQQQAQQAQFQHQAGAQEAQLAMQREQELQEQAERERAAEATQEIQQAQMRTGMARGVMGLAGTVAGAAVGGPAGAAVGGEVGEGLLVQQPQQDPVNLMDPAGTGTAVQPAPQQQPQMIEPVGPMQQPDLAWGGRPGPIEMDPMRPVTARAGMGGGMMFG